ncbi:hypothetical protein CYMTET_57037 [Cymbomonas tetramitiformis]|uniref:Uncharacterized protein n=1 Tax=Cymbomonas tetramitiformis TaxID=36881 RepID=A0AAE0BA27_9CHLO|nr:hypothetical protein CYMTET_57037 [Cymbomonas tetramitiformis]
MGAQDVHSVRSQPFVSRLPAGCRREAIQRAESLSKNPGPVLDTLVGLSKKNESLQADTSYQTFCFNVDGHDIRPTICQALRMSGLTSMADFDSQYVFLPMSVLHMRTWLLCTKWDESLRSIMDRYLMLVTDAVQPEKADLIIYKSLPMPFFKNKKPWEMYDVVESTTSFVQGAVPPPWTDMRSLCQ